MAGLSFVERLSYEILKKKSRIVVGLDPVIELMPKPLVQEFLRRGNTSVNRAEALWAFNELIIDGLADIAIAFKPQVAFYERYGIAGMRAYSRTIEKIRSRGVLAIGDVKRGDIGSTANAYAAAHLGQGDFEADAITISPFLGSDSIKPFLEYVRQGKGLYILVKTSNPSSSDFQDVLLSYPKDKPERLYNRIAKLIGEIGSEYLYGEYSNVGAVVGATHPSVLAELRKQIPHTPFLIPGYGTQGANAKDVINAFDMNGLGAVINSSRSIIYAAGDSEQPLPMIRAKAIQMREEIEAAIAKRQANLDTE